MVEKEWGIQVTKLEEKMGIKGSPTGQLVFDEVRVPATHLIGTEGDGFKIAMHTLDRSRPTIGAQAVGIAQGALDYAIGYMKERKAFGRPIADLQGLQFMVADAAMRIEAARGLVYHARARWSTRGTPTVSCRSWGQWPSASPRMSRCRSPLTRCSSSVATATRVTSPSSA